MNNVLRSWLLALCLVCACMACRTVVSSAKTVDIAMQAWGDYVRAGKATPEQQAKVKLAYVQYQEAMAVSERLYYTYGANSELTKTSFKEVAVESLEVVKAIDSILKQ